MNDETPQPDKLAICRQSFQGVSERLRTLEQLCGRIADLPESEAETARSQLAEARGTFSDLQLELLRELDVRAVSDPTAERIRAAIAQRYCYPTAINAATIVQLIEPLLGAGSVLPATDSGSLAADLAEAMRIQGDSKKSAAGKIDIAPKTLDRLLHGDSTKPVKQQAAWRYIKRAKNSG